MHVISSTKIRETSGMAFLKTQASERVSSQLPNLPPQSETRPLFDNTESESESENMEEQSATVADLGDTFVKQVTYFGIVLSKLELFQHLKKNFSIPVALFI